MHAGTARDALSTAEDEEAVIPNIEVAMVLFMGRRVCDVVVQEGREGTCALGVLVCSLPDTYVLYASDGRKT